MQWFFALNDRGADWFTPMLKAAVRSAAINTTLSPACLYDGEPNALTHWLEGAGVEVTFAQVPFREELFSEPVLAANAGSHYHAAHAAGGLLRTEVARYARDDVFLYTDCDVIFLNNAISGRHTDTLAAVPELNTRQGFNAGVQLINRAFYLERHPALIDYLRAHNFYHRAFSSYDQALSNAFFAGSWDPLPERFNWRPSQGENPDASIVHFHGPKPTRIKAILAGEASADEVGLKDILDKNPAGYLAYTQLFDRYLGASATIAAE
jgi:hypothetical protein